MSLLCVMTAVWTLKCVVSDIAAYDITPKYKNYCLWKNKITVPIEVCFNYIYTTYYIIISIIIIIIHLKLACPNSNVLLSLLFHRGTINCLKTGLSTKESAIKNWVNPWCSPSSQTDLSSSVMG